MNIFQVGNDTTKFVESLSIDSLFDNKIINSIIQPLLLLIIGWILKHIYDKYVSIKPRLYLTIGLPLYGQKPISYELGHELTWRYECKLKNNSKYDAFNIEIFEIKPKDNKDRIFSNSEEILSSFPSHNNIDSKREMNFIIKKIIYTEPNVLFKIREENGVKIVEPGMKIKNPRITLKPSVLDDIKLVVKYENEKGKKYYTKFRRKDKKEFNKICFLRPYLLKSLIK